MPPMAHRTEHPAYAATVITRVGIPESTAATRFPPVAKCLKPAVVFRSSKVKMIEATIHKIPTELKPHTFE